MDSISIPLFIETINSNGVIPRTIVEIGSLDGADSILLSKTYPTARVIAIEALKQNYQSYLENLSGIESFNIVISDYDGSTNFHVKNTNGIHSMRNRGSQYGNSQITLPCARMDTFCVLNNIQSIDVVKIDVEGCTYEVLEGFGGILDTVKIMHLETENHQYFEGQKLHQDVVNLLEKRNFNLVLMSKADIDGHNQFDSIWINKKN